MESVRLELIAYLGGKCQKCGYTKNSSALHFHHKNPFYKKFEFSEKNLRKSRNDLIKEADKCLLLCSNCHIEIHNSNKYL